MTKSYSLGLSVDELMAKARENADVDIIDHDVVEPLTLMHRALCEESQLHEQGAIARQNYLLRLLRNRLLMQRDFARHPEIADQTIKAPVIAYGMGRTGTTKTQKVLAATGDFNWLPFWQTFNPALLSGSRDESPEARIREADVHCRWFEEASPQSKFTHHFDTHEPEEDTMLAEHSFRTVTPMGFSEVPSYMVWLQGQSRVLMFEYLRDSLKYLQWQGLASVSKPWLLKAPVYFGMEVEMLKVFPDAHLVMTHRDPLQVVPSLCKLIQSFHAPYTHHWADPDALCVGFAGQMDYHLSLRKAHEEWRILDIHFDEIIRSMDSALEKIYAHAGMSLSQASRVRVKQWETDNPMHKKGANPYSLADFGLTAEKVNHRFAGYREFLKAHFDR